MPVLKVMSVHSILPNRIEEAVDQVVRSLRHQQSLVSLSLGDYHVSGVRDPSSPVSMENLKENILRNVDSEVVFRHIKRASIGTATTLRIAPCARPFHGIPYERYSHRWFRKICLEFGGPGE